MPMLSYTERMRSHSLCQAAAACCLSWGQTVTENSVAALANTPAVAAVDRASAVTDAKKQEMYLSLTTL